MYMTTKVKNCEDCLGGVLFHAWVLNRRLFTGLLVL